MRAAIKKRDYLIVVANAVLVEGILLFIGSHQHASHNLSLLLIFHLPGLLLAEMLHIPDSERLIVLGITGSIQLFVVFFMGWVVWKQIYGRDA